MSLANYDTPIDEGDTPYPSAGAKLLTSADRERRLIVRTLLAAVDGVSSARDLGDKLGVPRIEAARMIEIVLEYLEQSDFGVAGRGVQLARLDIAGNRILLPLILGPVSGRRRSMALKAYEQNCDEWVAVVEQDPPVTTVQTRVAANTTKLARSAAAPASAEAVERALELMVERNEILVPAPAPSARGFDVRHVRYVLDGRRR